MDKQDVFELKKEHLELLKNAGVEWDNCEFGAPCIDPKRPYGNSDCVLDILEILKVKPRLIKDGEKIFSDKQEEMAIRLHKETKTALQLLLLGYTELGEYVRQDTYDRMSWAKVVYPAKGN